MLCQSPMERSIQAIWNQEKIPVVLRRSGKGELLRVRLPFDTDNRRWLQNERRNTPCWKASRKFWEIPKAWFDDLVNRALGSKPNKQLDSVPMC